MRISDWSADVWSSDLRCAGRSSAPKASWCRDDGRSGGMSRVVVVGSFNDDHVWTTAMLPRPGETLGGRYATGPGGKGFNQAVACARSGARTTFKTGRASCRERGGQYG